MDINVKVSLDAQQSRRLQQQLAIAQQAEPGLTAAALASRLLNKLFNKWVDDEHEAFIIRNRAVIDRALIDVVSDPARKDKLAAIGLEIVDGALVTAEKSVGGAR